MRRPSPIFKIRHSLKYILGILFNVRIKGKRSMNIPLIGITYFINFCLFDVPTLKLQHISF
jgi:hypothetical protein